MKRATISHPKTYDLAQRLGTTRRDALGVLTLLWDWAADHAVAGDAGKWPNSAIAAACDQKGDPDEFVNALVQSKWLDECDEHRLVIHDWSDHCQTWVKAKARKMGFQLLRTRDASNGSPNIGNARTETLSKMGSKTPTKTRYDTRSKSGTESGTDTRSSLPTSSSLMFSPPYPPRPPTDGEEGEGEDCGFTWKMAERAVASRGVIASAKAVEAARRNGCTAGEVMALVEHHKANCDPDTEATLYHHVAGAEPGKPPEDYPWPPSEQSRSERQISATDKILAEVRVKATTPEQDEAFKRQLDKARGKLKEENTDVDSES